MKKNICLALIFLLLTGCSIQRVNDESFDSIIKTVLYEDSNLVNINFDGYKFYLPRGTTVNEKKEYNLEIKDNRNSYYLYVDTVSYFYKTKKSHELDKNLFYSSNLAYKDKFGYIDVSKIGDKYFLEIMYNYAKIESYVEEDYLYDAFLNICYILSTIEFNEKAIEYKLNYKELETKSYEFDIFKSKKDNDDFLEYIEEFDKYVENDKNEDQDFIETE